MKLIVFTDLDATLLDVCTYSWRPAAPALEALKKREALIVLVSSKTLAEMEPLHQDMGLVDPFIVENGGGIVLRSTDAPATRLLAELPSEGRTRYGEYVIICLGMEYKEIVKNLAEISLQTGIKFVGFSDMSPREIADLTGLTAAEAERARTRYSDEPFVVPEEASDRKPEIVRAAETRGLTIVGGGRFLHLMGHAGKGEAVSILMRAFRRVYGEIYTVGLGDSPNDYPFLELVDTAFILGGAELSGIPGAAIRTKKSGPEGWNEAVLGVLAEKKF